MNGDIYDDFKLKKPFGLYGLYKNISTLQGLSRMMILNIVTLVFSVCFKNIYVINFVSTIYNSSSTILLF